MTTDELDREIANDLARLADDGNPNHDDGGHGPHPGHHKDPAIERLLADTRQHEFNEVFRRYYEAHLKEGFEC